LDNVAFPIEDWGNVERVYINAQLGYDAFRVNDRIGESRVNAGEKQIWVEEDDEDWCQMHGFEWFQEYLATWVPRTPASEIQETWDEFKRALDGKQVRTKTPFVMVFATRLG
jgi:hypothetical protein